MLFFYCLFGVAVCTTALHDAAGMPRCDIAEVGQQCHIPGRPGAYYKGWCGDPHAACNIQERIATGKEHRIAK